MPFKLRGIQESQLKLKQYEQRLRAATLEGVEEFQKIELQEMKRRTPVDTGELRESGHYDKPKSEGNRITAVFRFDAPYAMFVHEDLEAHHDNGEAKFMESVLQESAPYFSERVSEYVRKKAF